MRCKFLDVDDRLNKDWSWWSYLGSLPFEIVINSLNSAFELLTIEFQSFYPGFVLLIVADPTPGKNLGALFHELYNVATVLTANATRATLSYSEAATISLIPISAVPIETTIIWSSQQPQWKPQMPQQSWQQSQQYPINLIKAIPFVFLMCLCFSYLYNIDGNFIWCMISKALSRNFSSVDESENLVLLFVIVCLFVCLFGGVGR